MADEYLYDDGKMPYGSIIMEWSNSSIGFDRSDTYFTNTNPVAVILDTYPPNRILYKTFGMTEGVIWVDILEILADMPNPPALDSVLKMDTVATYGRENMVGVISTLNVPLVLQFGAYNGELYSVGKGDGVLSIRNAVTTVDIVWPMNAQGDTINEIVPIEDDHEVFDAPSFKIDPVMYKSEDTMINPNHMDNDSILFGWKNRISKAYDYEFYKNNKILIHKEIAQDQPHFVYYKYKDKWFNYYSVLLYGVSRDRGNNTVSTEEEMFELCYVENRYLVVDLIPQVMYLDKDGVQYYIGTGDGMLDGAMYDYIDVTTDVDIELFSIDQPTLPFAKRHLMDDLKLTFKNDKTAKDTIIVLNGGIVSQIPDMNNDNIVYIRGGALVCPLFCPEMYDIDLVNAEKTTIYRVRLRVYKWQGVRIDLPQRPFRAEFVDLAIEDVKSVMDRTEYKGAPKVLRFKYPINPEAFLLTYNNVPVPREFAYVNPSNLYEVIISNPLYAYHISRKIWYSSHDTEHRPFYIGNFVIRNFESSIDGKKLYLNFDKAKMDITGGRFRATFNSDIWCDLITYNGFVLDYHIRNKNMIEYTTTPNGIVELPKTLSNLSGDIQGAYTSGNYKDGSAILPNVIKFKFGFRDI